MRRSTPAARSDTEAAGRVAHPPDGLYQPVPRRLHRISGLALTRQVFRHVFLVAPGFFAVMATLIFRPLVHAGLAVMRTFLLLALATLIPHN